MARSLRAPGTLEPACLGHDPDLFFSRDKKDIATAKRICRSCPLITACLTDALIAEYGEALPRRHGIFGGATPAQRNHAEDAYRARRRDPRQVLPHAGGRSKAPCGTEAAYRRHLRNNEPVDDLCRQANAEKCRDYGARRAAS